MGASIFDAGRQASVDEAGRFEPIDEAAFAGLEADAAEHRKSIKAGNDPLAERNAADRAEDADFTNPIGDTFKEAAFTYIAENRAGWKNPKHRQQWENTLTTYAYPIIGDKLAHEVTMEDVKRVLQQPYERNGTKATLWTGARETATRIRSRIES